MFLLTQAEIYHITIWILIVFIDYEILDYIDKIIKKEEGAKMLKYVPEATQSYIIC